MVSQNQGERNQSLTKSGEQRRVRGNGGVEIMWNDKKEMEPSEEVLQRRTMLHGCFEKKSFRVCQIMEGFFGQYIGGWDMIRA
jgi:hypothetical protein